MTEEKHTEQEATPPPAEEQEKKVKKSPGVVDALWNFFSSVVLAIVLLLIIATVSIIGTVLAQGDSAQDNIQLFQNFVVGVFDTFGIVDPDDPASMAAKRAQIQQAAERLYRFSIRAGFTNIYHTWYFYGLLGLFSLNITVCSIRRWSQTWKMVAKNRVDLGEKRFATMANRRSFTLDLPLAEAVSLVGAHMTKGGYKPRTEEVEGGATALFGQKGTYSRFGVYATHLSIIIILIGGIIGVVSGFKGYMQITEGTATKRFYNRRTKVTNLLPFEVRCDNFRVDYYPGGGRRPKDFYSDLVVVQDGEEKMKKRIEVNSPLVYDDIWFYQSSFGDTGRGMRASLEISDPSTGTSVEKTVSAPPITSPAAPPLEIEELGVTVQIVQVLPDFALDQNQRPVSNSSQPNNPAALVEIRKGQASWRMWVFQAYPDVEMAQDVPVRVLLKDYSGVQYTGLQVVYDPGVWVIWLGCTVMVIGLYLAFFVSHRRLWARVGGKDGAVEVLLAGTANKNREGFKDDFGRLGDRMEGKEKSRGEE